MKKSVVVLAILVLLSSSTFVSVSTAVQIRSPLSEECVISKGLFRWTSLFANIEIVNPGNFEDFKVYISDEEVDYTTLDKNAVYQNVKISGRVGRGEVTLYSGSTTLIFTILALLAIYIADLRGEDPTFDLVMAIVTRLPGFYRLEQGDRFTIRLAEMRSAAYGEDTVGENVLFCDGYVVRVSRTL